MSEVKEPHFFYNLKSPGSTVLGEKDLEEYLKLFERVPDGLQAGEASTSYLYVANAPGDIQRIQENAKIIIVLRNPVDRAYSQYWNQVRDGVEPLGFEAALEAETERKRQHYWHGFLYVETGRYADQVARYLNTFGHSSVRVYLFEDLVRDANAVCRDVFSFLEVDPDHPIKADKVYNPAGPSRSVWLSRFFALLVTRKLKEPIKEVVPSPLTPLKRQLGDLLRRINRKPVPKMKLETRRQLQRAFEDDTLRLERLIGRDLHWWRE